MLARSWGTAVPSPSGSGGSKATSGMRLTLTTATPVTTTDVTGATTIYLTPFTSNELSLYTGATWTVYATAEVSLALGTLTSGKNYDVFAYYDANASAVKLELSAAWSSDTAHTDALAQQDGVWVKSSDHTRRHVGALRTTNTTTTEDSLAKRFLVNRDNRVRRPMKRVSGTSSWTYATATWRQAEGSAANQFEYLALDAGVELEADLRVLTTGSANTGSVGIGIDSTTTPSGIQLAVDESALGIGAHAKYLDYPGFGYHKVCWLEISNSGTCTFYGTNSARNNTSGMFGSIFG